MAPGKAADAPPLPALGTILGRAQKIASLATSAESWLCRFFGVERQHDWPVAPYSCLGDGIDPGSAYWLRADPVHFHLQRDHFTLVDSSGFDLTLEEAQQYATALNAHFCADGLRFFAPCAHRWYLQLQDDPGIITHALADAIGRNVHDMMPQGRRAAELSGMLNEAQMLLHAHPANLQREDRGELPVNSFWLWGGGTLQFHHGPDITGIWTEDALARGLSLACDRAVEAVPPSCPQWLERALAQGEGNHLVVLDTLQQAGLRDDIASWRDALAQLERDWFAPLLQAMKSGQVQGIHLHFAELHRVASFQVQRDDLWKFWRRPKSLEQALSES